MAGRSGLISYSKECPLPVLKPASSMLKTAQLTSPQLISDPMDIIFMYHVTIIKFTLLANGYRKEDLSPFLWDLNRNSQNEELLGQGAR